MKKQLLFATILCIIVSTAVFAQEKGLKDKLKKIDGKAESVVVKTDKGTVTFSGKEADELVKMLKTKKSAKKVIILNSDDDEFSWNEDGEGDSSDSSMPMQKFKFLHNRNSFGDLEIELSDIMESLSDNKIHKKIIVQNRDGVKTVTITTKENGTEKIEILEGTDADKYLEEHKSDTEKEGAASKGLKKKIKKIIKEEQNEK